MSSISTLALAVAAVLGCLLFADLLLCEGAALEVDVELGIGGAFGILEDGGVLMILLTMILNDYGGGRKSRIYLDSVDHSSHVIVTSSAT